MASMSNATRTAAIQILSILETVDFIHAKSLFVYASVKADQKGVMMMIITIYRMLKYLFAILYCVTRSGPISRDRTILLSWKIKIKQM